MPQLLQSVIILAGVILFILILAWLARRFLGNYGYNLTSKNSTRRLRVLETSGLDVRTRLIICACDDKEYLVLLGHTQAIVLDDDLKKNNQLE